MKQRRWPLLAVSLVAVGISRPTSAQAQAAVGPPAVPRTLVIQEFLPGPGRWVSTVDNFNGLVGVANLQGTGKDDKGNTLDFECDVRVMQGNYIDQNGNSHHGTFCFT